MRSGNLSLSVLVAVVVSACLQPVVLTPEPEREHGPSTAATFGIPPGHLPRPGECRIWIPGAPPGQQPRPRSRSCEGILADAPAGSWVVYRPSRNRKYVHVRVIDEQRAGVIVRVRIFAIETGTLVRERERDDEDDDEQ
jgi:hypothetical protein